MSQSCASSAHRLFISHLQSQLPHLLAPAGSISFSLAWLLLLLAFSDGIGRMMVFLLRLSPPRQRLNAGVQRRCCRGFVEPQIPPPTSSSSSSSSFSLEWCHILRETDYHCQGDCVQWGLCKPNFSQHVLCQPRSKVSKDLVIVMLFSGSRTKSEAFWSQQNPNYTFSHMATLLIKHVSLLLWSFPAWTDLPSLLGKLQSVSAICSTHPPSPNYNNTRNCVTRRPTLQP